MSHILADRVLESTTTTGTGAIALAAAVTGFRRFNAVCAVGDTVPYFIEAVDSLGMPTGDYEYGIGTYSAANTLTRTTVLGSSNVGVAVSFATGSKNVAISLLASGFQSGSNANGFWMKHPNGIIEQWGSFSIGDIASASPSTATFPIQFPAQCDNVQLTPMEATAAGKWDLYLVSMSSINFQYSSQEFAAVVQNAGVSWRAIGR